MRRGNGNAKKKDDLFVRLTAVQLAAALLIFLLLFLLVRRDDGLSLRIRNEFESLLSQDWDIAGLFSGDPRTAFSVQQEDEGVCLPVSGNETRSDGSSVILTAAASAERKTEASCLTDSFYEEDEPVMPVMGMVTSNYGSRIHPITGEESFHSGRDIAADEGTDISAVWDGVVLATGVGEQSGNYIKIDHGNGMTALYCHCSAVYANKGDTVRRGDIIAAVGQTGAATGPHLHFEIRIDGELRDPAEVLDEAVCVR